MADSGQSRGLHIQAAEGTGDGSQSKLGQLCMSSMACLCISSVWEASHSPPPTLPFSDIQTLPWACSQHLSGSSAVQVYTVQLAALSTA